jgi:cholesterol transport system auxiliary component
MAYSRTLIIVCLFFASLSAGCMNLKQPSHKIDYFALEYEPRPVGDLKPLSYVLKVNRFRAAPLYNTTQMIYRDRPFKREAYTYHKWRTNPGDLVSALLARDIQRSGLFKAVVSHESRLSASHVLEGSVDEFLESDTNGDLQAVLTVTTTLVAAGERDVTKSILFQKAFHAAKLCREKSPKGLAEAMSQAMADVSQDIIRTLHTRLKEE